MRDTNCCPKTQASAFFSGLCLKQNSAILFSFGLGWGWGEAFATCGRKSNSLLVLHFEPLLQGYIIKPFLFPSTSWASIPYTLLDQNLLSLAQRSTGP